MATAIAKAVTSPLRPPIISPPSSSRPLNVPSKRAVFRAFIGRCRSRGWWMVIGDWHLPTTSHQPPLSVVTDLHFDGLRFCDFLLWQRHGQDAVGEIGLDIFGVHRIWNREVSHKGAIASLQTDQALAVLVPLELPLARHGNRPLLDLYVEL